MLAAAHGVISQLQVLHISNCVSWVLWILVFCQLSTWGSDPCDWTLCPYPWFSAHALYPHSWDAMSSVTWYWLPNVGRSCNSHWDLIACIIRYHNSDLTNITIRSLPAHKRGFGRLDGIWKRLGRSSFSNSWLLQGRPQDWTQKQNLRSS